MQAFITKVNEVSLSDIFQSSFELPKGVLENGSYVIIEHVLTEIAYSGALVDLFWSKHRAMNTVLGLYGRFHMSNVNILPVCPPGGKVHPRKPGRTFRSG